MSLTRKLKPDRDITGPLVPLSMLLLFGASALIFGLDSGLVILAALIWLHGAYTLFVFIRSGNWPHLLTGVYQAFLGWWVFSLPAYINNNRIEKIEFMVAVLAGLVFFGALLVYLVVTRKIKWRGREIFELAAEPVEESENGYTSRPRPIGKLNFHPDEIRQFA
jgi:hypothetical protein